MRSVRFSMLALAALFLTGAVGPVSCTQQAQDDEATLLSLAARAKQGVGVAAQDLQAGIDLLCSHGSDVGAGVQNIKAVIAAGGSGPKTATNLRAADKSLAVVNSVCASAPSTGSAAMKLFLEGWNAYQTAKGAAHAATVAAASGT